METTKIRWAFEGLESVFETEADKLEATATKLRGLNNLTYDHPITILSNGNSTTIEPTTHNVPVSGSGDNTKKRKSVSKSVKDIEFIPETPIVQSLLSDVDFIDSESDAI
jgi:hypothetical protein